MPQSRFYRRDVAPENGCGGWVGSSSQPLEGVQLRSLLRNGTLRLAVTEISCCHALLLRLQSLLGFDECGCYGGCSGGVGVGCQPAQRKHFAAHSSEVALLTCDDLFGSGDTSVCLIGSRVLQKQLALRLQNGVANRAHGCRFRRHHRAS